MDQQLKETEIITPNDTIISGPMSAEKPNVGKLVQLSDGFLMKQYQSTIWVLNPAYPTENFLGSNTSQFETNVPAETLDKPSGSSSVPTCPRNPSVCLSEPRQPLSAQRWPCVSVRRPCVSLLVLYVSNAGLSEALHNSRLPLCGPA